MAIDAEPFHSQADVMRRLRDVERELQQLQTARRLPNASFTEPGEVRFFDATGRERFAIGQSRVGQEGDIRLLYRGPTGAGSFIMGTQLLDGQPTSHGFAGFYSDGTQLFRLADPVDISESPFFIRYRNGSTAIYLASGDEPVIATLDGVAVVWVDEHGLARPHQYHAFADGWFGDSVDGSSFEAVAEGWIRKSYPQLRLQYRLVRTGTPTVEVRLRDMADDATIAGPVQHAEGGRFTFDAELRGDLNSARRYELQARIVSGATSARFAVTRAAVGLHGEFSP